MRVVPFVMSSILQKDLSSDNVKPTFERLLKSLLSICDEQGLAYVMAFSDDNQKQYLKKLKVK